MIIINPVVTTSNIEEALEEGVTRTYSALMNFKANDQLNRILKQHDIEFSLLKRNISSPFVAGHMLKSDLDGISVLTVGVSPDDNSHIETLIDDLKFQIGDAPSFYVDSAADVPGAAELLKGISECALSQGLSWVDIKAKIKEQYEYPDFAMKKEVDV